MPVTATIILTKAKKTENMLLSLNGETKNFWENRHSGELNGKKAELFCAEKKELLDPMKIHSTGQAGQTAKRLLKWTGVSASYNLSVHNPC